MQKCVACGAPNPDGKSVCYSCGESITQQAAPPQPRPIPPKPQKQSGSSGATIAIALAVVAVCAVAVVFLLRSPNTTNSVLPKIGADPVEDFKKLCTADFKKIDAMGKQRVSGGSWLNGAPHVEYCTASDLAYDVQKTESVVSPLVGVMSFTVTRYVEEDAGTGKFRDYDIFEHEHTYAQQDGRWVLKEKRCYSKVWEASFGKKWEDCQDATLSRGMLPDEFPWQRVW